LTITNSKITGNSVESEANGNSYGGGIWDGGGTLAVINCMITGNSARNTASGTASGGGIYIALTSNVDSNVPYYYSTVTIINCQISENSARSGGGIYISAGTMTIINSTMEVGLITEVR
jgi:opacity protein-like surface antigen